MGITIDSIEETPCTAAIGRAEAKARSLRGNMLWTLLGNFVYAACQWGLLAGIAKRGTPELAGRFGLALAIAAPVYMLVNLQLRSVQATDARRLYSFGNYLGLRYVTTLLGLCAVAAIGMGAGYAAETCAVIVIIGVAKAFESVSDVYYGLLQQRERMDVIAKSMIVKGMISVVALNAVFVWTKSLTAACAALGAAWLAVLVAYDIPQSAAVGRLAAVDGGPSWSAEARLWTAPERLMKLTALAAPLGLAMMLASLTINIPRYFIEHYLGERDLGIFAAMAYVIVAGTTVINALGQAATPRLANAFAAGLRPQFLKLLMQLIGVGLALGAGGVLIAGLGGRPILSVLYRPEYAERLDVFVWLMAAAAFGYVGNCLGYALTAARMFREGAFSYVLITLITLVACVALIPRFGLLGAAWSTLATTMAACVTQGGLLVVRWRRGEAI